MEQTTLFIIVFYSVIFVFAITILFLRNSYLEYQLALRSISGMPYY
jgi:hypothetical protein